MLPSNPPVCAAHSHEPIGSTVTSYRPRFAAARLTGADRTRRAAFPSAYMRCDVGKSHPRGLLSFATASYGAHWRIYKAPVKGFLVPSSTSLQYVFHRTKNVQGDGRQGTGRPFRASRHALERAPGRPGCRQGTSLRRMPYVRITSFAVLSPLSELIW